METNSAETEWCCKVLYRYANLINSRWSAKYGLGDDALGSTIRCEKWSVVELLDYQFLLLSHRHPLPGWGGVDTGSPTF